jgi:hypothetical protein
LIYDNGKLKLGRAVKKHVLSFDKNLNIGDWVSVHWDRVCEKISAAQKMRLQMYTLKAIDLANK